MGLSQVRGGASKNSGLHGERLYEQTKEFSLQGTIVPTEDEKSDTAGDFVMAINSPLNHSLTVHSRQRAELSS